MKPGRASRTAQFAAGFRALETARRPARDRLVEDPFAVHFLPASMRALVRVSALPALGGLVRANVERNWPGAMTSGVARTRLIDDWVRDAVRDGIDLIVILGTGFDSRAYRLPELATMRVVEIDHPDTQALKRAGIARLVGTPPANVAYLAADLSSADLRDVLRASNLNLSRRAFVIWEGVTHYLPAMSVERTLREIATTCAPGSRLVFTYIHRGLIDGTIAFDGANLSRDRVSGEGEPWIFGFDPASLATDLAAYGLTLCEDHGADNYRARYWGEAGRRMRGFSFYRAALAEVPRERLTSPPGRPA
ncbi:MAG: class I SAM-dependent methyltransferase [Deltaproteobacteria bacterium]|nr:class I SAM-dependent methyltransferase [Deltaproteobacteria bacterium]